ncbi:hypothetical protein AcV5_001638 [Taiwanofungus camphoratus]|nr:hypothetical protein AcV5_001638 [Antrodia cinnamomea]KAI0922326.1 hypothetical protein AcV7_005885 [Antrodia cinnamomea]
MPALLRAEGFVNIDVEERTIPLGSWAGQDGTDARDNCIGVFKGMKTPILNSGGLGYVESEEAFDHLLDAVEKEWDATQGATIKFNIISGQKPSV